MNAAGSSSAAAGAGEDQGLQGAQRGCTRRAQRGAEVIEFGFICLPMLALVLLNVDIGWAILVRSTLQHAVREGVRYAVTSQTYTGLGQKASVQKVVQDNALGLLAQTPDLIKVRFYLPDTFQDVSSVPGGNAGGHLVEVSIEGYPLPPLAPLMRSSDPLIFTARSADRMESSPAGGPPPM